MSRPSNSCCLPRLCRWGQGFSMVPALYTTAVRSPGVRWNAGICDMLGDLFVTYATAHNKHPTWIAKYLASRMRRCSRYFQIFNHNMMTYSQCQSPWFFPMKHGPKLFLSAPLEVQVSGQESRRHLWDVRSMLLADKLWGSSDGKLRKTTSEL